MKSKGDAGEHLCTNQPYGYMKDPENKKRWIVDGEAAEVIKRNAPPDNPCHWTGDTIADILERPEYQGHTVNFKTYKQSYKSKKVCYNPEEKWLVFENTHEAIMTLTHGNGCRNYGRTNDARRGRERQICFPALCAVPIAAKSCITAQAGTLKQGKTISYVPLPD